LLKRNRFGIFVSLIEMDSSDAIRVLVFQVGDLACGVPAEFAREVLPTAAATRIPGAHPVVDGLANVRGSILTVIDGHRLLDRVPLSEQEGVTIVLDLAGRVYGLRVGQVHDLYEVREEDLEPGEDLVGVDPALVRAVGRVDRQHFVLLDIESLLQSVVGT
jgi:chemotaxis signal transduction protein